MATATKKGASRKSTAKPKAAKSAAKPRPSTDTEARASERAMQESQAAIDRAEAAGIKIDGLKKAQLDRVASAPQGLVGKELKRFIEDGTMPSQRGDGQAARNGNGSRAKDDTPPFTKAELDKLADVIAEHDALYAKALEVAPKGEVRTGLLRVRQSFKQTLKAIPAERTR